MLPSEGAGNMPAFPGESMGSARPPATSTPGEPSVLQGDGAVFPPLVDTITLYRV
jgi:hypothetical protein